MADHTKIEWTDATWNPIVGCSVISPGCTNCYAMRLAGTRMKHHPTRQGLTREVNGNIVWTGEVRFNEAALLEPLRWRRPRMIFAGAHTDLFHEAAPDAWLDRALAIAILCPQHTLQLLTKRPERARRYLRAPETRECIYGAARAIAAENDLPVVWDADGDDASEAPGCRHVRLGVWPLPNVWMGVSIEDQRRADERVPILLDTPAAVRWVSAEPMLEEIRLDQIPGRPDHDAGTKYPALLDIDWVVAGGESGPNARPMHPGWARSLRDQCAAADVPFLFKQWGEWLPFGQNGFHSWGGATGKSGSYLRRRGIKWPGMVHLNDGAGGPAHTTIGPVETVFLDTNGFLQSCRVGKRAAGRHLDGVLHDAYPEVRHG